MATEISPELLAAYQATEYWVCAMRAPFCLSIGQRSGPLARLFNESGCGCAAFITAHNPFSEPHSVLANGEAHERLRKALSRHSTVLIEGVGRDAARLWPEEKSFLALGLPLPEARRVGKFFRQNAIVWAGSDAVPGLIVLR